jgi:hypothetical protein
MISKPAFLSRLALPFSRPRRWLMVGLPVVLGVLGGLAVWATYQAASAPARELATMLPQGALMTVEARDFGGLLKEWSGSREKSAWLKSDNYGVFSRSHLFGRLGGAQDEFAAAAGLPPDMAFLNEVAGKESVFAWYDIGNLEFLYITHMPAGTAAQTRLMQMRGKFDQRKAGGQTFYVRTQGNPPRTVAFATSGDWLLLATREDLMAGALGLMADAGAGKANSLAAEPWFVDARAAAAAGRDKSPGELQMTLNLAQIVPSPQFRSYWVQGNISEMKQYRAAVADLYAEAGGFREERVLQPKVALEESASPDLAPLVALVPVHAGVFRAVASPTVDEAVASVNEKLLERAAGAYVDAHAAPEADVAVQDMGSASDLETRIDAAPAAQAAKGSELEALRQALQASGMGAMMTVSRTGDSNADAADGVWVPFQSAVVLWSEKGWDQAAMQSALQRAMQARLTAGGLGLEWKPVKTAEASYFEMSETRPLEMAMLGKFCILADDPALMVEILARMRDGKPVRGMKPQQATLIAGFDPPAERKAFARWTGVVDHVSAAKGPAGEAGEPAFFAQNMRGMGDVFAAMQSERVVERRDGAVTRQTVTYAWQH